MKAANYTEFAAFLATPYTISACEIVALARA